MYHQDLGVETAKNEDQRINLGRWVLTFLCFEYLRKKFPNDPVFVNPEFENGRISTKINCMNSSSMDLRPASPLARSRTELQKMSVQSSIDSSNNLLTNGDSKSAGSPTQSPNLPYIAPMLKDKSPLLFSPMFTMGANTKSEDTEDDETRSENNSPTASPTLSYHTQSTVHPFPSEKLTRKDSKKGGSLINKFMRKRANTGGSSSSVASAASRDTASPTKDKQNVTFKLTSGWFCRDK